MLAALIAGERNPGVLPRAGQGRLRAKLPSCAKRCRPRCGHHALLIRLAVAHLEQLEAAIAELDTHIDPVPPAAGTWPGGRAAAQATTPTGGKRRSGKPTRGNRWLGEVLARVRLGRGARGRDPYLSAQYWRLARRIGKQKAAVAGGHSILVIAWHLLADNCDYQDLGDSFIRRDTDRQRQRAVAQLQALGYHVTLQPVAA
jgi:transposase